MARAWIEDRAGHAAYKAAVSRAKKAGRTPPGRWRVRWYDVTGKPRAKVFTRKPEAEDYRTDIEMRLRQGTYRDPSAGKVKLAEVAESWHAGQVQLKRSSAGRYREVLDGYVLPRWGSVPVASIHAEDVSEWLSRLLSEPGKAGRPLGPARVRQCHRVLHMVLAHAVKSNRIAVNPAAGVRLPRNTQSRHVYLTHAQVEALADAAGDYRLLILVMAYTGLRWGEVSALRVRDIDLDSRRIKVERALADEGGRLYEDTPKGHERRSVAVPAFLAAELKRAIDGRDADALVFTAPKGGPLRAHNFRPRVWRPAVRAAGLEHLGATPHDLRHTAVSLAIAAGADVKVIQQMVGHKSAAMTLDVYGHLFPDRLDEVADALDEGRAQALAALPKGGQ